MSLAEELKVKTAEYSLLCKEKAKLGSKMAKLNTEITNIKSQLAVRSPSVTDHAILRLLERKYGIDIDKIKQEILCPEVMSALKVGAKKLKHGGMEYILDKGLVITIIK